MIEVIRELIRAFERPPPNVRTKSDEVYIMTDRLEKVKINDSDL